jgi:uncharacterized coiled-coil protein SlyX
MAITNSNKFLDLHGLELVWGKISEKITAAQTAATITDLTWGSANDQLEITWNNGQSSKHVEISKADANHNGLMSKEMFTKLTNIAAGAQVNVVESLQVTNGTEKLSFAQDPAGGKTFVLMNVTDLTATQGNVLAPTADTVKKYVDKAVSDANDLANGIGNRVTTLEATSTAHATRLTTLEATSTAHATQLTTISTNLANHVTNADKTYATKTALGEANDAINGVKDRATALENTTSSHAARLTALENTTSSHASRLTTIANDLASHANYAESTYAKESSVSARLKEITDDIAIINGADTVTGSIANAAKNAAASAVATVVANSPTAFDTLKEIADWIASDESGTADLVAKVNNIEKAMATDDELSQAIDGLSKTTTDNLAKKVDKTTFEAYTASTAALIGTKADTSYVNTGLNNKVDKTTFETYKGTVSKAFEDAADDLAATEKIAVTSITSTYNVNSKQVKLTYAFIDNTSTAQTITLCESISDTEIENIFK